MSIGMVTFPLWERSPVMGKKKKRNRDRTKKPPPSAEPTKKPADSEYEETAPDPHTGEGVRHLFGSSDDDDKHFT